MSGSPTKQQAWVLIESGSNQDFIFQSNRQHFHVGASDVLKHIPTWVDQAITYQKIKPEAVVVKTSSKAMLLVDDLDAGRRVIASVTTAALRDAPGLDVWGVVEDQLSTGDPMDKTRIEQLHQRHASTRWQRPTPRQREPLHPFLEVCTVTGRPATGLIDEPGDSTQKMPVSALAKKVFRVAEAARTEMVDNYGDAVLRDLTIEVVNSGWVAVVHADGNGVGDLIKKITTVEEYRAFSTELEEATKEAFTEAVTGIGGQDWLVPLIIGGDDVTVLCDASRAVDLTRSFLTLFEKATAAKTTLAAVAQRVTGRGYLTASAGIAAVKPHYPFHAAYDLAEELARSAKEVKRRAPHRSSYDLHVLHDSIGSPLADIRDQRSAALQWWVGPLLAARETDSSPASPWEIAHEDATLITGRDALAGDRDARPLSGASLHDLRTAILAGSEEMSRMKRRLHSRQDKALEAFLNTHLRISVGDDPSFTRVLTVMDMADLLLGRAEGERQQESRKRRIGARKGQS